MTFWETSLVATAAPSLGSQRSSPSTICSGRPSTPPLALICSAASLVARSASSPNCPASPVSGPDMPIRIGSPLGAAAAPPVGTAAAVGAAAAAVGASTAAVGAAAALVGAAALVAAGADVGAAAAVVGAAAALVGAAAG